MGGEALGIYDVNGDLRRLDDGRLCVVGNGEGGLPGEQTEE